MKFMEFEDECNLNSGIDHLAIIDTDNYFDEVASFAPGLDIEALKCFKSLQAKKGGKAYKLGAQCKNNNFIYYME